MRPTARKRVASLPAVRALVTGGVDRLELPNHVEELARLLDLSRLLCLGGGRCLLGASGTWRTLALVATEPFRKHSGAVFDIPFSGLAPQGQPPAPADRSSGRRACRTCASGPARPARPWDRRSGG